MFGQLHGVLLRGGRRRRRRRRPGEKDGKRGKKLNARDKNLPKKSLFFPKMFFDLHPSGLLLVRDCIHPDKPKKRVKSRPRLLFFK